MGGGHRRNQEGQAPLLILYNNQENAFDLCCSNAMTSPFCGQKSQKHDLQENHPGFTCKQSRDLVLGQSPSAWIPSLQKGLGIQAYPSSRSRHQIKVNDLLRMEEIGHVPYLPPTLFHSSARSPSIGGFSLHGLAWHHRGGPSITPPSSSIFFHLCSKLPESLGLLSITW